MRRKIIAGNWKMNKDVGETITFINDLKSRLQDIPDGVEVVVCPPFTSLAIASQLMKGSRLRLGAQNMHYEDDGPFTGEISGRMLKSVGCEYVIIGHSERRAYFHETDDVVNRKVQKAFAHGLRPIVCVGESLDERERGLTEVVVGRQLKNALEGLSSDGVSQLLIAYEPVWAIGTGRNATPAQAEEVHVFIRNLLSKLYNQSLAQQTTIQYGGSVKSENAADLLSQPNVDGALIGGASLRADEFARIISSVSPR